MFHVNVQSFRDPVAVPWTAPSTDQETVLGIIDVVRSKVSEVGQIWQAPITSLVPEEGSRVSEVTAGPAALPGLLISVCSCTRPRASACSHVTSMVTRL